MFATFRNLYFLCRKSCNKPMEKSNTNTEIKISSEDINLISTLTEYTASYVRYVLKGERNNATITALAEKIASEKTESIERLKAELQTIKPKSPKHI